MEKTNSDIIDLMSKFNLKKKIKSDLLICMPKTSSRVIKPLKDIRKISRANTFGGFQSKFHRSLESRKKSASKTNLGLGSNPLTRKKEFNSPLKLLNSRTMGPGAFGYDQPTAKKGILKNKKDRLSEINMSLKLDRSASKAKKSSNYAIPERGDSSMKTRTRLPNGFKISSRGQRSLNQSRASTSRLPQNNTNFVELNKRVLKSSPKMKKKPKSGGFRSTGFSTHRSKRFRSTKDLTARLSTKVTRAYSGYFTQRKMPTGGSYHLLNKDPYFAANLYTQQD